jgi:iron complex outermembrane receptor protein
LSTVPLVVPVCLAVGTANAADKQSTDIEALDEAVVSEVVVTSQRRQQVKAQYNGNIAQLDASTIERVEHQHINELMSKVAGAWVVRGSGQEHQTAIRSPVLGGGGACAGFLFLEDGIPVRPTGFCNINQFIEMDTEQARSIEVIRGPGNALFGSNALHGIVNILMPMPGNAGEPHIGLEFGANDFVRARVSLPFKAESPWFASAIYADDGGFREDSGYRQGKMHLKRSWSVTDGEFTAGFTATDLRQDTAGFIYGKDAYKDSEINRSNPTPEAFRNVNSQRLYGLWSRSLGGFDLDIRPYIRHSDMQFMHFELPGQPVEDNGQTSAGVISAATFEGDKLQTIIGLDVEWADAWVRQTQAGPASGPPRQQATRPQGKHYDYEVRALSIGPFVQTSYQFNERFSLGAGLRLEYTHYDYNNRMLAGNTREDGTACGFGGCLYTRPADRTDGFTNLAPNLSAGFQLSAQTRIYANLARGFRAPQMLELYRLQNGQQVSDLDSERVDSLELGLRRSNDSWSAEFSVYTMRKKDSVFRDAEGYNVSGARSRHRGVEIDFDWQVASAWYLSADASYAQHEYDFDYTPNRGESFVRGNDIDTAPRWLASAELRFAPAGRWWTSVQWTYLGEYYLDPSNRRTYPGHQLLNLRVGTELGSRFDLVFRLNNLADKLIAERADFGSGDYRYLPGRGRELFVEVRYFPLR